MFICSTLCLAQLENDKTFMSYPTLQVAFTTCISKYKHSKRCPLCLMSTNTSSYQPEMMLVMSAIFNSRSQMEHCLIGNWLSTDFSIAFWGVTFKLNIQTIWVHTRIRELPLKTPRDQLQIYASTLVQGTDCRINLHVFDRGGTWRTWRKPAWHRENM